MTAPTRAQHLVLAVAVLTVAVPALAQQKAAPKKGEPVPPPAAVKKVDLPTPPANFEYASEGRRDPFVNLVNRGEDGTASKGAGAAVRAEGVPGLVTGELSVKGIMQARGAFVAMVAGPDRKVYTVRAGDKLADGVIRAVTSNAIVILQEVHDPLSLEKQREVRKFLRGGEEVKK
jgi:Tfp pilus assembly protein PilP